MKNYLTPSASLKVLAAFSVLPIIIRVASTGNVTGVFLLWNLFLAWLPIPFAKGFAKYFTKRSQWLQKAIALLLFSGWLLLFPNAPYIVTDLIHLDGGHESAYWLEAIVLFSIAMAGLFAGIYSMYIVHRQLERVIGKPAAWSIIIICSFLSGFGIYLGRVQRWNSWDIIAHPFSLLRHAFAALGEPMAIEMTIGFGLLVIICYIMLVSLVRYEKYTG